MTPARPIPAAAALLVAASVTAAGGCASAPRTIAFEDAATLRAERDEWRGDRTGAIMLRRHIATSVDTAADPQDAESSVAVGISLVRYGGSPQVEVVRFDAPAGATLAGYRARVLDADGETAIVAQDVRVVADDPEAVDPGRIGFAFAFAPLAPGTILELTAALDVPGTVTADAHWLALPALATGELLLSWSVPMDAEGALAGVAPGVAVAPRSLVTETAGRRVHAIYLKDLPARGAAPAYARYVTTAANPRGYAQRFAGSWRQATEGYLAGLVAVSEALREGYAAPFVPADPDPRARAERAYLWVRDRLQADGALAARWDAARPLAQPIQDNTLTATDKVHLLHWLLDAAGVDHRLAVARAARWPALDPAVPAPGAFDAALLYVPAFDLWLDPACRACAPGAVRPELAGGQALPLPADSAPVVLP